MATVKGRVVIRGRFPDKAEVQLLPRSGDQWPGSVKNLQPAVAKATMKDGEATFEGLEPGLRFWAYSEPEGYGAICAAVTSKVPPASKPPRDPHAPEPGKFDPSTFSHGLYPEGLPPGVRGPLKGLRDSAGKPADTPAPNPAHLRVEDLPKGTAVMSATFTGQATPVQPPPVRQDEVDDKTPQASATGAGVATPVEEPKVTEKTLVLAHGDEGEPLPADLTEEAEKAAKPKPRRKSRPKKKAAKKPAAKAKPKAKPKPKSRAKARPKPTAKKSTSSKTSSTKAKKE